MFGGGSVTAFILRPRCLCIKRCTLPSVWRFAGDDDVCPISRFQFHTTRCSSSSPNNGSAPSKQNGLLSAFANDWNQTLSHHPQTVLASFLSVQATTWLGLYTSLSLSGTIVPPSLAAGWAVSKFSKKFRQPVNAAMAAVLVRTFPILAEVKVTPLVTGLVMGDKDKKIIAKQIEANAPPAMPVIIEKVANGAKWLEGPVDKYGLSYYLSSRISGVSTLCISAYLVHQGVDVGAYLSSWGGAVEGVGDAVGTAAAASVLNVFFVPLHFYSSVYGVRALEGLLQSLAKNVVDAKNETEKDHQRDYNQHNNSNDDDKGDKERNNEESGHTGESEYERIADGAMRSSTLLLLTFSLVVSLYSFRVMGEKATTPKSRDDTGINSDDQK